MLFLPSPKSTGDVYKRQGNDLRQVFARVAVKALAAIGLYPGQRLSLIHILSVILGGLVFGFAHGYSYFMIQGGTITGILSEFGGGIVGALVFSAIYEKSKSIGWSILIHACLDFAGYLM